MRRPHLLALLVALTPVVSRADATLIHTGYLLGADDRPITGPLQFEFSLLPASGAAVWESGTCTLEVQSGYFTAALGGGCGPNLPDAVAAQARSLALSVEGTPLTPAVPLGSVPRAAQAASLVLGTGGTGGLALISDESGAGSWGQVGNAALAAGAVTDAQVATGAAIETGKLSGPVTAIANHGLGALATRNAIENADVAPTAAIATSKLSGAVSAIADNGLGTLATRSTIADADVSAGAAIATSKLSGALSAIANNGLGALATKGTIVDADVAPGAAIAGAKVTPAFGAQAVSTTGNGAFGSLTVGTVTNASVPRGAILMWSGTLATIPVGWALCDGANGTPNLLDRFVLGVPNGSTDPGATGGAHTQSLTLANLPSHDHSINHSHGASSVTGSVGGAGDGRHTHIIYSPAGHTWNTSYGNSGLASVFSFAPSAVNNSVGYGGENLYAADQGAGRDSGHGHGFSLTAGGQSFTGLSGSSGSGTALDNRPAFYRLAYIIKL